MVLLYQQMVHKVYMASSSEYGPIVSAQVVHEGVYVSYRDR